MASAWRSASGVAGLRVEVAHLRLEHQSLRIEAAHLRHRHQLRVRSAEADFLADGMEAQVRAFLESF